MFRVRGLVVEVDCNNQVSAHTAADPGSPVSVLHNSPFYSPVKQTVTPGLLSPSASSNRSTPFMEAIIGNVCSDDPDGEMDSINQDDPQEVTNDSDEGIESEEGDEDIDGEAFKQLIRYFKHYFLKFLVPKLSTGKMSQNRECFQRRRFSTQTVLVRRKFMER